MRLKVHLIILIFNVFPVFAFTQVQMLKVDTLKNMDGVTDPGDADPRYIGKFTRANEVRGFFRAQNSRLEFGSLKEISRLSNRGYFKNTTDQIGLGVTYKIINLDLSFSLPNKRKLDSIYQDVKQFRLAFSYTGRKFGFRYYLTQGRGLVVGDPLKRFYSNPDVSMFKTGAQMIYIFNEDRYSLRASFLQNEIQRKTAGSFLAKADLFYYNLKTPTGLVTPDKDLEPLYGNQVGLKYLRGPGLLMMPGYGMNFTFFDGQLYVSPVLFVGAGMAYNFYTASSGSHNKMNLLLGAAGQVNFGYNTPGLYTNFNISHETTHISLNPSFISDTDFRFVMTVGFRFGNLEKVIPASTDEIF
ncbi:DUF4421 family protein [Pollutibacter soli]|uniref:DUF4421 family protein n=1 Tax=Pollutibacter soli TaxID=3034157 RepID=UPI0030138481